TVNSWNGLGLLRRQSLPDGTAREFDYLRGGGLNRVSLGNSTLSNLILFDGSDFNARGQRTRARLGNNVEMTHSFGPEAFRTNRIQAQRLAASRAGALTLQDIEYTYDPVGNITHTVDNSQQPAGAGAFLQGLNVAADSDYTYDSFYQLIIAEGR